MSEEFFERPSSVVRFNETRVADRGVRGAGREEGEHAEKVLVHPFFGHETIRQPGVDVEQGGVLRVRGQQHYLQRRA